MLDAVDVEPRLVRVVRDHEAQVAGGKAGEEPSSGASRDIADVGLGVIRPVGDSGLCSRTPTGLLAPQSCSSSQANCVSSSSVPVAKS